MRRALTLLLFAATSVAACASSSDSSTSSGNTSGSIGGNQCTGLPQTCVAFETSFTNFRTWASDATTETEDLGNAHLSGPRTTYIQQKPPAGSKSFPIGTIIVKEMETSPDLTQRQVFAMVKRGEGFNAAGAADWEWFELKNLDAANTQIVWRGTAPPPGETYAGSPASDCNACHSAAKANDYVQDKTLTLQ